MEDYQKQQVCDKFASYTEVKDADVSTVLVNSDAIENKASGPLERFCNDIKSIRIINMIIIKEKALRTRRFIISLFLLQKLFLNILRLHYLQ